MTRGVAASKCPSKNWRSSPGCRFWILLRLLFWRWGASMETHKLPAMLGGFFVPQISAQMDYMDVMGIWFSVRFTKPTLFGKQVEVSLPAGKLPKGWVQINEFCTWGGMTIQKHQLLWYPRIIQGLEKIHVTTCWCFRACFFGGW